MNLSQNRLSQKFKTSGFSRLRYIPYRVPFDVVCFGKRHGPYRAVKGAVRRVNKWLKRNEQFSQEGSFDDIITDAPFQPPKVLLRVRTRCSRKLQVAFASFFLFLLMFIRKTPLLEQVSRTISVCLSLNIAFSIQDGFSFLQRKVIKMDMKGISNF